MSNERDLGQQDGMAENLRSFPIKIPIGVAFDLELLAAGMVIANREKDKGKGKDDEMEEAIFTKLRDAVPPDLVIYGPEKYKGDLNDLVELELNFEEVKHIGEITFDSPTGKTVAQAFPDYADQFAIFDALRNRQLLTFLALEEAFVEAGGKRDVVLVSKIGQQLS